MRRDRGSLTFILLNIILSAGVAFAVIRLAGNPEPQAREVPVTFVVRITQPPITPQVLVVTTTPQPGSQSRLDIPDDVREGDDPLPNAPAATLASGSTGSAGANNSNGQASVPGAALPAACIEYVIDEGDVPSSISAEFDISLFDLMTVNGLDDETATRLQIGQTLIIPLDGCPLLAEAAPTDAPVAVAANGESPEATPETTPEPITQALATATPTPTIQATVTLAPTAENADVQIIAVNGVGDITTESIEIANEGNIVDLTGWTLRDGQGNVYTFPPDRWLFSQASIVVNSGFGQDTALQYFWNRDVPVFERGDVVVLTDADGVVQASVRL